MAITSFATSADVTGTPAANLWRGVAAESVAEVIDAALVRASRWIETACDRRLLTFTLTEQHRGWGVPADKQRGGLPVAGAEIQVSYAAQLGGRGGQPGQVWLEQIPPQRADLWDGEVIAVTILQPYAAGSTPASVPAEAVEFDPGRGYLRFGIGTYVEPGATVAVTYTGGYTSAPEDLTDAAVFVAARRRLLLQHLIDDNSYTGQDLAEEIDRMLDPYRREPRPAGRRR